MAGMTISAASSILKNLYLPPVRELLDNATVLLKMLEKEVQPVEGTNFTVPLHESRNSAAGQGRAEGGTLATAGQQGYASAIVPCKFLYSRIKVTGPVIEATKSNKGSFLRVLDSEMKGVTKDTLRSFNRQLHSDGRDALGFWVSGATTSIVVDDGLGNAGYDFVNSGTTPVEGIDSDNATVNWGSASTGGLAKTAVRSTLGATGRTLTINATVAVNVAIAAGDFIIEEGTFGNQMTGIQAVISKADPPLLSGGLHGLTVAAHPDWVSQFVEAGGATTESTTTATRHDLSFPLMQQVFSSIATNSDFSEADIKVILSSFQMRDTYVKLCQDERRIVNNMKLDGGFEGVSYNGKPIVPDVHCRHNRMYFITPETMKLFRMSEMDWIDKGGDVLYRISGGDVDSYGATLRIYQELGCLARNGNGLLCGVLEQF